MGYLRSQDARDVVVLYALRVGYGTNKIVDAEIRQRTI